MTKQTIEITQELFSEILRENKQLQETFIKALTKALEYERVQFVIHFSVSDFLRALEYSFKSEIREAVQKAIEKALQKH